MDRRDTLKLLLLGAVGTETFGSPRASAQSGSVPAFSSEWHHWPDMRWVGPEYWGNRLQDWRIRDGVVECTALAPNRTLHRLTGRLVAGDGDFGTSVSVDLPRRSKSGYAGFRIAAKGPYDDVRSAAVFGTGRDAGVTTTGEVFIGDVRGSERVSFDDFGQLLRLTLTLRPSQMELAVRSVSDERVLARLVAEGSTSELAGNIALVSHFDDNPVEEPDATGLAFSHWQCHGSRLSADDAATFGPIAFAQYTLHRGTLKLTAQLAPIDRNDAIASLELQTDGSWRAAARGEIDALSRTAHFRLEDWEYERAVPYRVRLSIPVGDQRRDFFYAGTIAKEPSSAEPLCVAVFSCNADHGFPDTEVVHHASQHRPHLAVFLGDQFYESTGGFGIQTSPLDEASLDVLRKWMMFGWSYRELFRNIPVATIPDDHDVYHGNIWGEGGKPAPTEEGWGYVAQDQGGFKMPAEWVNAVQRMQTSHLPDPAEAFHSNPVRQGIGVYYTQWDYGGVSFAILEDRKFKSAPGNVLPPEARVVNGWIRNSAFDLREHRNLPGAELLGARQMRFLESWSREMTDGVMKVVLSQTNFAAVHTIPESAESGAVIPELPMPEPGNYVQGDKRSVDLDSNGWPQNERDAVLRILRRCSAFHIAGDQHLATVVRHGIDAFDDAGYTFTGPALNNIWPRRWWPPVSLREGSLPGAPDYCGRYLDGLGNRITVHASANPRHTGLEPAILRDRVTGYGIVTFDKAAGTIRMECWPRHADRSEGDGGQYEGWPITIRQKDRTVAPGGKIDR